MVCLVLDQPLRRQRHQGPQHAVAAGRLHRALRRSRFIDATLIFVLGIVPQNPNPQNPRNHKWKNPLKFPCQTHFFARPESVDLALSCIAEGCLSVVSHSDPSFALSESAIVQEKNPKEEDGSNDDIFASVGAAERKERILEPSDAIVSPLFLHHKLGLGWLVDRENSLELPPFWEKTDGGDGKGVIFRNVLTCYRTDERPEPLRSGILADEMGLGKKLTLISLIATNRPGSAVGPKAFSFDDEECDPKGGLVVDHGAKMGTRSANSGRKRKSRNGNEGVDSEKLREKSKRRKAKSGNQIEKVTFSDLKEPLCTKCRVWMD